MSVFCSLEGKGGLCALGGLQGPCLLSWEVIVFGWVRPMFFFKLVLLCHQLWLSFFLMHICWPLNETCNTCCDVPQFLCRKILNEESSVYRWKQAWNMENNRHLLWYGLTIKPIFCRFHLRNSFLNLARADGGHYSLQDRVWWKYCQVNSTDILKVMWAR